MKIIYSGNQIIQKTIDEFFSGDNAIQNNGLDDMHYDIYSINEWLENFNCDKPVIIPLVQNDQLSVIWYGIATDSKSLISLTSDLRSLLEGTTITFTGIPCTNDDPVYLNKLSHQFQGRVVSFSADNMNDINKVQTSLNRYLKILNQRPEIGVQLARPFGKIRYDFEMAISAGNRENAEKGFQELMLTGRIDAVQKIAIRIRMLSGLGFKNELINSQELIDSLIGIKLTARTIEDIADALYEVFIRPIETESLETVANSFIEMVGSRYRNSFLLDRNGIRKPTVLRLFLLNELTSITPDKNKCSQIIDAYPSEGEGGNLAQSWFQYSFPELDSLTNDCDSSDERTIQEIVKDALYSEDYLRVISLCKENFGNSWFYNPLIRAVYEFKDMSISREVLVLLDKAGDFESYVDNKNSSRLAELKLLVSECSIEVDVTDDNGWLTWCIEVNNSKKPHTLLANLDERLLSWSSEDHKNDVEYCTKLVQQINNCKTDAAGEVFRQVLPKLVDFFVEETSPNRLYADLYISILLLLGVQNTLSRDELDVSYSVSQTLFDSGASTQLQRDCVDYLCEIMSNNGSILNLDWALSVSDMLIVRNTDESVRMLISKFFYRSIEIVKKNIPRISLCQKNMLKMLSYDFECVNELSALFPDVENIDVAVNLSGKRIGIYSLAESAATRAKRILEAMYEDVDIRTNSDHVATPALQNIARNSDFFIFAAQRAKHQAFFAIQDIRQGNIIYPTGKGSSSIVTALNEHLLNVFN